MRAPYAELPHRSDVATAMQSLFAHIGLPPAMAGIIGMLAALTLAIIAAILVHRSTLTILHRIVTGTSNRWDDILLARVARPLRWILIALALSFVERAVDMPDWAHGLSRQLSGFVVPALVGWLAITIIHSINDVATIRHDITVADNLAARRQRTRLGILTRIAVIGVAFLTICMMLLSIPGVRAVGITLMASAGLAGLAVGAAAQPALKNLIAGVQLAFTEPIRLDDIVVVDGEWGHVEEIRLTYVVVKIWDERRLIVPVAKFLEQSFQNWTRSSSQLLGAAKLQVDLAADVPRLREQLSRVVKADPNWDGRVVELQVTDIGVDTLELRALVSAADAGKAFDLRCRVREAMMAYIAREMPEALPQGRVVRAQPAN